MQTIWLKARKNHKLVFSHLFTFPETDSLSDCLVEMCREIDEPCPIILNKHEKDWQSFSLCRFAASDFMETVSFDLLELERCKDEEKAGR